VGFDGNPVGAGGPATVAWGPKETLTHSIGAGFSVSPRGPPSDESSLKLGYQGESVRFDRMPGENFSTHRFGVNGQVSLGDWKLAGEGTALSIAGSLDTLPSLAAANANAITLWRERRRQWQHRVRLQAQTEADRQDLLKQQAWSALPAAGREFQRLQNQFGTTVRL